MVRVLRQPLQPPEDHFVSQKSVALEGFFPLNRAGARKNVLSLKC